MIIPSPASALFRLEKMIMILIYIMIIVMRIPSSASTGQPGEGFTTSSTTSCPPLRLLPNLPKSIPVVLGKLLAQVTKAAQEHWTRVVMCNLECSCLHPRLPKLSKHFQVIT